MNDIKSISSYIIDTNVFIDAITKRPGYEDSIKVIQLIKERKIKGFIGANSINDIFYIVRRYSHSAEKAYEAIGSLIKFITITPLLGLDISRAYDLKWHDFEDCLVYIQAKTCRLNGIITKNKKDFGKSDIPVYLPSELLELVNKENC